LDLLKGREKVCAPGAAAIEGKLFREDRITSFYPFFGLEESLNSLPAAACS
jgi:hypothetical protein